MSSANTYSKKYCTYITHYSGKILPPNYIGSTSIEQINNGYYGSVTSKKYKSIWKYELKTHPELFSIDIISTHDTRREATYKELQLQKMFNVVKSDLFINLSYATKNGCFGSDKTKENNPNYRKSPSNETRLKQSISMEGRPSKKKGIPLSKDTKQKMSKSREGNSYAAKYYEIIDPNNNKFLIKNLKQFCRDNNLTYQLLVLASIGKQKHHKKYKCKLIT